MNRSIKKIFSLSDSAQIAPGASWSNEFDLTASNQSFKIKSISWDYSILEDNGVGSIATLPIDTQTTQEVHCIIGIDAAAPQIHSPFDSFSTALTPGVDFNGTRIYIYKPKQLLFDSWFVEHSIKLQLYAINRDLLKTYNYRFNIIIEIEIIDSIK